MILTDLRLSSLRFSILSGLRLSARVFFLISLAVCFLPRLCSTCRKIILSNLTCRLKFKQTSCTFARKPPKWAPMLESTFFFLASSSALFFASSSSFLCLSSCGAHLFSNCSWVFGQIILFETVIEYMKRFITASLVCLSRSFSALTRCCSALSALRLSWKRRYIQIIILLL